jgi:hypothetical protein
MSNPYDGGSGVDGGAGEDATGGGDGGQDNSNPYDGVRAEVTA